MVHTRSKRRRAEDEVRSSACDEGNVTADTSASDTAKSHTHTHASSSEVIATISSDDCDIRDDDNVKEYRADSKVARIAIASDERLSKYMCGDKSGIEENLHNRNSYMSGPDFWLAREIIAAREREFLRGDDDFESDEEEEDDDEDEDDDHDDEMCTCYLCRYPKVGTYYDSDDMDEDDEDDDENDDDDDDDECEYEYTSYFKDRVIHSLDGEIDKDNSDEGGDDVTRWDITKRKLNFFGDSDY